MVSYFYSKYFFTVYCFSDLLGPKAFAFVKADVNGNITVSTEIGSRPPININSGNFVCHKML